MPLISVIQGSDGPLGQSLALLVEDLSFILVWAASLNFSWSDFDLLPGRARGSARFLPSRPIDRLQAVAQLAALDPLKLRVDAYVHPTRCRSVSEFVGGSGKERWCGGRPGPRRWLLRCIVLMMDGARIRRRQSRCRQQISIQLRRLLLY